MNRHNLRLNTCVLLFISKQTFKNENLVNVANFSARWSKTIMNSYSNQLSNCQAPANKNQARNHKTHNTLFEPGELETFVFKFFTSFTT